MKIIHCENLTSSCCPYEKSYLMRNLHPTYLLQILQYTKKDISGKGKNLDSKNMENENSYSRNIHSCEMNIKTCKIVNPWCPLGIRFPKMLVMLLLMKYNDLSTYTQKGKKKNLAQETRDLCGSTSTPMRQRWQELFANNKIMIIQYRSPPPLKLSPPVILKFGFSVSHRCKTRL
jgi:hypothetical protein